MNAEQEGVGAGVTEQESRCEYPSPEELGPERWQRFTDALDSKADGGDEAARELRDMLIKLGKESRADPLSLYPNLPEVKLYFVWIEKMANEGRTDEIKGLAVKAREAFIALRALLESKEEEIVGLRTGSKDLLSPRADALREAGAHLISLIYATDPGQMSTYNRIGDLFNESLQKYVYTREVVKQYSEGSGKLDEKRTEKYNLRVAMPMEGAPLDRWMEYPSHQGDRVGHIHYWAVLVKREGGFYPGEAVLRHAQVEAV